MSTSVFPNDRLIAERVNDAMFALLVDLGLEIGPVELVNGVRVRGTSAITSAARQRLTVAAILSDLATLLNAEPPEPVTLALDDPEPF